MAKDTFFGEMARIRVGESYLDLSVPRVMGVLNITPDSFHAESRVEEHSKILERAGGMLEAGADILDLGAYSSRPGAEHISEELELERLLPALEAVREAHPNALLSVDTFRASVASKALKSGADIVNDISAGLLDPEMMDLVASEQVPYIMMHMPGTPQDMQERTDYEDVTAEVFHHLSQRIELARDKGVSDLLIDPGFGFGKTLEQNFRLLEELESFKEFGLPLLVGVSRKSMVGRLLGVPPSEALNGTTVLNTLALQRGADILRVHDVREAVEAVRILKFGQECRPL